MTNSALQELKDVAKIKINVGNVIFGVIELNNGRYRQHKPSDDPRPVDDQGVPFKSFSDEIRANGWSFTLEPDKRLEQGSCR